MQRIKLLALAAVIAAIHQTAPAAEESTEQREQIVQRIQPAAPDVATILRAGATYSAGAQACRNAKTDAELSSRCSFMIDARNQLLLMLGVGWRKRSYAQWEAMTPAEFGAMRAEDRIFMDGAVEKLRRLGQFGDLSGAIVDAVMP